MIEHGKGHYLNLEERRDFYKQKLGDPINTDIYNYYINMMDTAIQHRANDADANPLNFPHSVGTKQELIKIIMIIQADAIARSSESSELKKPIAVTAIPTPIKKKIFGKWRKK